MKETCRPPRSERDHADGVEKRAVRASELPTAVPPSSPDAVHAPTGLILDRYRLLARLGAGAFATVWRARDERLQRDVALKIMPPERIVGGRFEREARAAARLAHPGIVTLYEAAIDGDGAYLVTELVRGATLGRLLEQGSLSDRDIVVLAIALCDALGHAHSGGVVHRDVKPSNVLVPEAPVSPAHVAKLTDFGVASVVGGSALTRAGDVLGTLAYMAPEQAEGLPVGPSADLYSLALVIYEGLTGVNPAARAPRVSRLGTHLPPLRRRRRDLPIELGQGVDLALRPRPRERGDMEDLRESLAAALPHLTGGGASPSSAPAPPAPPRSENRPEPHGAPERESAPPDEPRRMLAFRAPPRPAWPARAVAGAAAATTGAVTCGYLLQPRPAPPAVAALVAGVAVAVAPRLGWLLVSVVGAAVLAIVGMPGDALVIFLAALIPAMLLPSRSALWPLPAGALLLGVAGLGGGWPALASRAGSAWRRAALGIAGFVWLAFAGELRGSGLYARVLPGTPAGWGTSLDPSWHHVIASPALVRLLLTAAVWGAAAALLPVMRSRRSVALDAAMALIWAVLLAGATLSILGPTGGASSLVSRNEVVLGLLASAAIGIALRAASSWRIARRLVEGPVA